MRARLLQLFIASALGVRCLVAQSSPPAGQSGLSLFVGGGSGSLKLPCNGCAPGYRPAANSSRTWRAGLGFANSPRSIIGFEYDNYKKTHAVNDGTDLTLAFTWYDLTAQWYLTTSRWLSGLYVKGAIGVGAFHVAPGSVDTKSIGGGGGVGYDVPLPYGLAITPYYDFLMAERGKTRYGTEFGGRMPTYGISLKVK